MKILQSDFLLLCNEDFTILQNKAIVYDKKIIDIGNADSLRSLYPQAKFTKLDKNSILLAGLINPHIHLEFSANKSLLSYGNFISWLNSIIQNKDEIMSLSTQEIIKTKLNEIVQSGTTCIGAISSLGLDLVPCKQSPLRVVFFNEILGSNQAAVDIMFEDFQNRLGTSLDAKNERFTPSISVHSPYSTHPVLAKKALQMAFSSDMVVSTHFLESFAERQWLENGNGDFINFFANLNPHAKPFLKPLEFIELFKNTKTIFTHCCYAKNKELKAISKLNSSITHCPRSNRLLGSQKLDLQKLKEHNITLTLGTDGLSSNNSLSLWDEMRTALFSHENFGLEYLAKELLKSVTINGAKALGLKAGSLEKGYAADMIVLSLEQIPQNLTQLPLQLILHTRKAKKIFIEGCEIAGL